MLIPSQPVTFIALCSLWFCQCNHRLAEDLPGTVISFRNSSQCSQSCLKFYKSELSAGSPRKVGGQLSVIPSVDYPWKHSNPHWPSLPLKALWLSFSRTLGCAYSMKYNKGYVSFRKSQLGIWSYVFCLHTIFSPSSSSLYAPLFILGDKLFHVDWMCCQRLCTTNTPPQQCHHHVIQIPREDMWPSSGQPECPTPYCNSTALSGSKAPWCRGEVGLGCQTLDTTTIWSLKQVSQGKLPLLHLPVSKFNLVIYRGATVTGCSQGRSPNRNL